MASENELTDSLRQSLEERGILSDIKSRLRLEILKSLNNEPGKEPKEESEDNFLINELIKEYCSWNGYLHTSKVLSEESGHPSADLSRSQLESSFRIHSVSTEPNDEAALFRAMNEILETGVKILVISQKPWTRLVPLKNPHHFALLSFAYPQNLNHYLAALFFKKPDSAVIIDYHYSEISVRQFTKIAASSSELASRISHPVILRCKGEIFRTMGIDMLKKWTSQVEMQSHL